MSSKRWLSFTETTVPEALIGIRQFKLNKYSFWLNIFSSDKAKNVSIASYDEAF